MDVIGEDQALQAVLGRGDFCGIDNEALDFSQLEDYINDDDENIYFPDSMSNNNDVKGSDSVQNRKSVPEEQEQEQHQSQGLSSGLSLLYTLNNYNSLQAQRLPDSPPDSGSEPPFSPVDDRKDNKINAVGPTLEEMLMQPPVLPPSGDEIKQMLYANTQPLKHLSESPLPLLMSTQTISNSTSPSGGPATFVPVTVSPLPMPLPSLFGSTSIANTQTQPTKKRKLSDSTSSIVNESMLNGMVLIKKEPGSASSSVSSRNCLSPDAASDQSNSQTDDDYNFDFNGDSNVALLESSYQCIRFQPFQQTTWHVLCDRNLKELPTPNYRVDADKGFNFSNADEAFVCQKKNHFQVTVHVQTVGDPQFVKTSEGLKKVDRYYLHFNGVKVESTTQMIRVEQSQSDRSKKPFHPVLLECSSDQVTKVTVGRLHFSETTSNNMRKKGKPNPDQRYFYLVVSLHAHCTEHSYVIASHASERIIVRASNPGQFENDVELCWQKGHTADSTFHMGRVGVNTDHPEEALVVHGNIKVTGHIMQPSDVRAKENVQEVDTKEQLRNLQQLRIVRYQYIPDFAYHVGLAPTDQADTGVIAQEVQQVIPDAVKEAGDIILPNGQHISNFLVVNKERIFMENVGAVKELCKVTDNLENRIDELERMNRKLAKLKRIDSLKSTSSNSTVVSRTSSVPNSKASNRRYQHQLRKLNDQSVCSNKFVQMTITTLIIVMALCLVAMAILYILEWQNRQLNEINHYHGALQTNVNTSRIESKIEDRKSTPFDSTISFHVSGSDDITWSKSKMPFVTVDNLSKPPPAHQKPTAIGTPVHCLSANHLSCHIFCCDLKMSNSIVNTFATTPTVLQDVAEINMTQLTPLPYIGDVVSLSQLPSQNLDIYEGPSTGNDVLSIENSAYGGNEQNTLGDNIQKTPNDEVNEQDSEMALYKRETKQRNSLSKTRSDFLNIFQSVLIPELNVTIGNEYCYYRDQCSAGNYTYLIPVSKFMPNQSLTLQFQLSSTSGVVIDLCQKVTNKRGCYISELISNNIEERKEGGNISWLLPIGYFVESSYKFRLSNRGLRHQAMCETANVKAGDTFVEFNFIFHRTCEDSGKNSLYKSTS